MKILLDTCVVVDIIGRTKFFCDAFAAYDIALFKKMDVYLSASSTTDIAYLMHSRGFMSKVQAREVMEVVTQQFDIMDNCASDAKQAAQSNMSDYEDALIAYAAARNGVDYIVTRNVKDFAESPVVAISPSDFVELYRPSCLEYEEIAL